MVELIALFTVVAIAMVVIGGLAIGLAMVKLFVWLVLLPFRLAVGLLALPFVFLGVAFKLLVGLLLLPVLAIGAVIALLGLVFAIAVPLIPILFLVLFVWVIVKLASRTPSTMTVRN